MNDIETSLKATSAEQRLKAAACYYYSIGRQDFAAGVEHAILLIGADGWMHVAPAWLAETGDDPMSKLGKVNRFIIDTWKIQPNSRQLAALSKVLASAGGDANAVADCIFNMWRITPSADQIVAISKIL